MHGVAVAAVIRPTAAAKVLQSAGRLPHRTCQPVGNLLVDIELVAQDILHVLWIRCSATMDQDQLRLLWRGGIEGHLCPWEQARALALRDVFKELFRGLMKERV